MAGDEEERNRIFGIPVRTGHLTRQVEQQQRVLGFPVDWFRSVDLGWLGSVAHAVRAYRRYARSHQGRA